MNEGGRGALTLTVGMMVARMTMTGSFGDFVQQRMRWPLVIAAVLLIALGAIDLLRWIRTTDEENRRAAPAVGLLMVIPTLIFVAVAPTALGAAAADRVESYEPPPPDNDTWSLPDDDPLEMRMVDFVNHALYDEDGRLEGRSVVLEGIVVNDPEVPDGFVLVRFLVSCCAADGIPLKIALRESPESFDDDTWVRAVVTWVPPEVPYNDPEASKYIEAVVEFVEIIDDPPDSPYESPY
ncbi:MAG: TIGR03943 family protein [Actinomycetota bacterium]